MKMKRNCLRNFILFGLIALNLGCQDQQLIDVTPTPINETNWELIGIGQEKDVVLKLLGEPDYVERTSVLGVERERLMWRNSLLPNKFYQLDLLMGHVVGKSSRKAPLLDMSGSL